jgi:hypothetical protein
LVLRILPYHPTETLTPPPRVIITNTGYDASALRHVFHDDALFPTHAPSYLSPPASPSQSITPKEARVAFTEFTTFLLNLSHLSLTHSTPSYRHTNPRRHTAFLPNSPLHRLLSAPPTARVGIHTPRIQRACRLASLIYINAALWDFRTSTTKTDAFLKALKIKVIEHGLDWNISPESFTLTILDGVGKGLDREGRTWFTGRMVNVAKRLCRQSWDRVEEWLMGCLTMEQMGWEGEGGSFWEWEMRLRDELMEAPLSWAKMAPAFR